MCYNIENERRYEDDIETLFGGSVGNGRPALMRQARKDHMTMERNEALQVMSDVLVTGTAYTSMNISDRKTAVRFYNATANPAYKLKEHVNEVIEMSHISIEAVGVRNEQGDYVEAPRIVIIDKDGNGYGCVSVGVLQSLKRLCSLIGTPDTWDEPVKIKPVLVSTKKGQVLSIQLV